MFKAVTAHSIESGTRDIVDDLVGGANVKLGIYRPSTGIFYTSAFHDTEKFQDILKGISEAFPGIEIVGGTVVAGFTDDSDYIKDGYFLCLFVSNTATFVTGRIRNVAALIESQNFSQTFSSYLKENSSDKDPVACFIWTSYHNVDGDKLIDSVQGGLPENCLVFGGMAGDYWTEEDVVNFSKRTPPAEKSLLFFARSGVIDVEEDALVFLLFEGDLTVRYSICNSWSDIGMLYPARGDGTVLTEIDGKEPRTFLRELKHPLALEDQSNALYSPWVHVPGKDPYIRDLFFDSVTGNYYTMGANLPSRFQVSFSFPKKEKVLEEFHNSLCGLGSQQSLVIATTCCTHMAVLGQDISKQYSDMARVFHRTPTICGYVFGEFGPSMTNRESILHSCSSILLSLQEKEHGRHESQDSIASFFDGIIREQGNEIKSLQKQLRFFEGSKNTKMKKLTEDCLGMLLCRSHKSVSSHAEQMSDTLKAYYKENGTEPPYATSRNRLIDHLMTLKKLAEKF
ncbi:FIST N-terminal domain-containing protein [Desulfosediminicola sp.]|uniref:FIST N-terminal domain-containing protein n=1 Tax=Desulfosediminicola sp. TaxID=2886825 RepID=UPI003AF2E921